MHFSLFVNEIGNVKKSKVLESFQLTTLKYGIMARACKTHLKLKHGC